MEPLLFIGKFTFFCSVHSLLAVPSIKARLTKIMGRCGAYYRLGYNLLSLLLLVWLLSGWSFPRVIYLVPGVWSLFCYLAQLALLYAMYRCIAQTGLSDFIGIGQFERTTTDLITTGCYGKVRHPLYSLGTLFLCLNPVMTTRWLIFGVCSVIYFFIGAMLEEKRLIKEFDGKYQHYRRSVPMFVPRMGLFGQETRS